jgi:hypothetical protein
MAASDYVPLFFKNRLHLAGRPQMSTRPSGGLLFRFHLPSFALSASDWGDFMRKSTDCILMLRPWSWSTFMATLLAVAFATTMQKLFAEFGARLCSLAYFPRS